MLLDFTVYSSANEAQIQSIKMKSLQGWKDGAGNIQFLSIVIPWTVSELHSVR